MHSSHLVLARNQDFQFSVAQTTDKLVNVDSRHYKVRLPNFGNRRLRVFMSFHLPGLEKCVPLPKDKFLCTCCFSMLSILGLTSWVRHTSRHSESSVTEAWWMSGSRESQRKQTKFTHKANKIVTRGVSYGQSAWSWSSIVPGVGGGAGIQAKTWDPGCSPAVSNVVCLWNWDSEGALAQRDQREEILTQSAASCPLACWGHFSIVGPAQEGLCFLSIFSQGGCVEDISIHQVVQEREEAGLCLV